MIRSASAALLAVASLAPNASEAAAPQHSWQTYGNARFEFTICFPTDMLSPQPEADNGDGRAFVAADGTELLVWGTFNSEELTPPQVLAREVARITRERGKVTYKTGKPGWYALSGTQGNTVFYQRGLSNGVRFASFRLVYPKAVAAKWNPVAARLSACLKDGE